MRGPLATVNNKIYKINTRFNAGGMENKSELSSGTGTNHVSMRTLIFSSQRFSVSE